MLDKRRGKAYREILAGIQYHRFEKLSFITFGFKRGSVIDCRTLLHQIDTWVKREFKFKMDYIRVEVWENKKGEDAWRVHVHMIWNAPYIKQGRIVEKVQSYIGEEAGNANVFIKLLEGDPKKSARYLMQYLGNQEGKVYYTKSREWLPKGYNDQWEALKHDFYEKVRGVAYTGCKSDGDVVELMSHNDDTWRFEGLIKMMNDWVERKALKRFRNYDFEEGVKDGI